MYDMTEKLDKIRDEIEELEQSDMNWSNLEKLSILYNIEYHLCKKMEMQGENEYSNTEMGFSSGSNSSSSQSHGRSNKQNTQEMRTMANNMNRQELADVIVTFARELNQNGNNASYNKLYNRMRRYSNNGDNNTER